MQPEESRERGERDARQSREGSGSDLGRVANEKDLRQRTKEFALQIIRLFSELPKTTEAQVLGKQVLRSGTSVGANYREAYRARRAVVAAVSAASRIYVQRPPNSPFLEVVLL